jgi:hypothetical protein
MTFVSQDNELAQTQEELAETRQRSPEADRAIDDPVKRVLTGLYQLLLGRQPDAEGLQH